MKPSHLLFAVLAAAAPLCALEISLEENRGERGSIGYVDLQAVFRRYPETQRAKQSYSEIVRQAEEQLNLKKAEVIRLRAQLVELKAEREKAAAVPIFVPPPVPEPTAAPEVVPTPAPLTDGPPAVPEAVPPAPAASDELTALLAKPVPGREAAPPMEAPAAKTEAPTASQPEPTPLPGMSGLPGMSPLPAETAPARPEPLTINIPGMPEEQLAAAPEPAVPAAAAPAAVPEAPAVPEVAPVPASPPAPAGPTQAELQARAEAELHRRDARVKELDAAVAAKTQEIADKELGLKDYQVQVEKNLVDIESKRSEVLLGKIYKAVREAAVENAVSVVIDKSAILFGQGSVDLTDKVLKKLEGVLQ
ncbi:MAG: OmpH family outer membrane protein [Elusimicrobia bacterium]|nr:OmpH family outer membrane protein [Elusimicrobiota bacterium]